AGQHTYNRTTGGTASRGMTDTIGYEEAHAINPNVTNSLVDNMVHQYAWYRGEDDYGGATVTQVNNICCLGYEDIYGHKYDMMDGVDLPNDSGNAGKWRIWMPDGTTRMVKGGTSSGVWITAVAHGKYMDVVPVGSVSGSSSTHYCDMYYISTAASRVVYRGYNGANPVWRCLDVECELRFLECEHDRRFSSGLPRSARQGGKRRCVQIDKRGGMTGRVKRQSGSEATKRPVFPE
ncbi:hypothetical protein K0F57_22475, partial [Bacteroides caccae]|nr:hypothetical protein [Bacteroides caccae]